MAGRTDPEETKQEILSATLKLLAEHNYSGISMGSIADVCSITKPAIYYHFKNKQDLFRQLALYVMGKINDIVFQYTEQPSSAKERLTGICNDLFRSAEKTPYVVSAYLTMLSDSGMSDLQQEFMEQFKELSDAITGIIRAGIKTEELNPDINPVIVSRIYQSTILGFMEGNFIQKDNRLPEPREVVSLLFSGIENR